MRKQTETERKTKHGANSRDTRGNQNNHSSSDRHTTRNRRTDNVKIFTVYDVKAEAYLQPFFTPTSGTAIRSFAEAANSTDHDFNKYAEDYTLFEIGEWDENAGTIMMLPAMKPLGNALTYIQAPIHMVQPIREEV